MARSDISKVLVVAAAAALATPPAAATIFYQRTIAANGGSATFNSSFDRWTTPSGLTYMYISGGEIEQASWDTHMIVREYFWLEAWEDHPILWFDDYPLDIACSVVPSTRNCEGNLISMLLNETSARVNYDRPIGFYHCDPFNGVYWETCGMWYDENPMYFSVRAFGPGDITLTITDTYIPGAVPEPESWALLIAGFGLTGAAMRRRRASASGLGTIA